MSAVIFSVAFFMFYGIVEPQIEEEDQFDQEDTLVESVNKKKLSRSEKFQKLW